MRSQTRRRLLSVAMVSGLSAGVFWCAPDGRAQMTTDPDLRPTERGTIERRGIDEGTGPTGAGPTMRSTTPRTDQAVSERERMERERLHDRYGDRDRHHKGETYVAGFGGWTFGGSTSSMDGRGSAQGVPVVSPDLEDSIVYGMKIGYFHPGRLNWLGLEIEGYNSNPHLKQTGLTPGTHLRVTTLGLNAIARTKLACRDRSDHRGARDHRGGDDHDYSPLADNARCPVHLYAGAGLGVFFAETSNQFGRSTDNARAGFNGLAGLRFFINEHVALFTEYKFNYVDLKFDQNQLTGPGGFGGSQAGLSGTYMIHHVVGGLSVHF